MRRRARARKRTLRARTREEEEEESSSFYHAREITEDPLRAPRARARTRGSLFRNFLNRSLSLARASRPGFRDDVRPWNRSAEPRFRRLHTDPVGREIMYTRRNSFFSLDRFFFDRSRGKVKILRVSVPQSSRHCATDGGAAAWPTVQIHVGYEERPHIRIADSHSSALSPSLEY